MVLFLVLLLVVEYLQVKKTGKCEALFDFDSGGAGELNFKTGDIITTTEWVNDEWLEGELGGQTGIFPLAFVKVLEELPKVVEEKAAQKGVGGGGGTTTKMTSKQGDDSLLPRAVAKMSYQARSDLECSLKVCLYILTDTSRRYVGNIMLEMQWC